VPLLRAVRSPAVGSRKVSPAEAASLRGRLLHSWRLPPGRDPAPGRGPWAWAAVVLADRQSSRRLLGAEEAAQALTHHLGVPVIAAMLEEGSLRQQAALLAGATALMGVCGAALANALFLPVGSCLVELFLRFRELYAHLALSLGLRYVAWPPGEEPVQQRGRLGRCKAAVIDERAIESEGEACRAFLPNKRRDFRISRPAGLADALRPCLGS